MKRICTNCGYQGSLKKQKKGNIVFSLILWIVFFPIAIVYSFWRYATKSYVCPKCGAANMIPVKSVVGKQMISGIN